MSSRDAMSRRGRLSLAAILSALACQGAWAQASSVPPASGGYSGWVYDAIEDGQYTGYSFSGAIDAPMPWPEYGPPLADFTYTATPVPRIAGYISTQAYFGHLTATLNYAFQIVSNEAHATVPILISGAYSVFATSGAVSAEVKVNSKLTGTPENPDFRLFFNAPHYTDLTTLNLNNVSGDNTYEGNLEGTFRGSAMASTLYTGAVTPSDGYVTITITIDGGGSAMIDPLIQIDPAYLAAHPDTRIIVSEGIGNEAPMPAVPEPSDMALLGAGLLTLAVTRRVSTRAGRPRTGTVPARSC